MYAIIENGGKQYKIEEGKKVRLEKFALGRLGLDVEGVHRHRQPGGGFPLEPFLDPGGFKLCV